MTTEWTDLPTLQDVAKAQADGWEIEYKDISEYWLSWSQLVWSINGKYRGRPRQPVMRKVKMLCWVIGDHLEWFQEGSSRPGHAWIRIPAQDIEIEIPEVV